MTDVNTLADGEPRNNFLERALTRNDNGILKGGTHLTIGGRYFSIAADAGMVVLDMSEPLKPKLEAVIPLREVRASAFCSHGAYRFKTIRIGRDETHVPK